MLERIARRILVWLVVLALAWAVVVYVWPTRYRYNHVLTDNEEYPVRIDRVTGDAEMLTPDDGWVPMGPARRLRPVDGRPSRTS
jgi:hypothetical protein